MRGSEKRAEGKKKEEEKDRARKRSVEVSERVAEAPTVIRDRAEGFQV